MPENPFQKLDADLMAAAEEEEFTISVQAVRKLHAGLMKALIYHDSLADSMLRDRYSANQVVNALNQFLLAHEQWRPASVPLTKLQAALVDLDNGHQAAMLQPTPVEVGRPVSWFDTKLRTDAAAIMGGLIKHARMSKEEAAGWVAKRLGSVGCATATGTVIDWRKRALNSKANPGLHQTYCTILGQANWKDPIACAERLVANLARLQSQKGG